MSGVLRDARSISFVLSDMMNVHQCAQGKMLLLVFLDIVYELLDFLFAGLTVSRFFICGTHSQLLDFFSVYYEGEG